MNPMSRTFKDNRWARAKYLMKFICRMGNPHLVSSANFWDKEYKNLVKQNWCSWGNNSKRRKRIKDFLDKELLLSLHGD